MRRIPLIDRFEAGYMPEPNSGCWILLGSVFGQQGSLRGKIRAGNRHQDFAYRVAYRLFKGEIPAGLLVCHRCDTTLCVNPDHLWLGTPQQNMDDMVAKGRHVLRQGALNPSAKLTDADVRAVRSSGACASDLADLYGVSLRTIRDVISGRKWSHVQ